MYLVYTNQQTWLNKLFQPIEKGTYRLLRINPETEMTALQYIVSVIWLSVVGIFSLVALQLVQTFLPFSQTSVNTPNFDLAVNTAVSFITNTNWQAYSGESTFHNFVQMAGFGVQNFISAAIGMSVLVALIRGIVSKETTTIGNFWVDCTKTILYILVPLSVLLSVALVSQGVVQTFDANQTITTVEGIQQTIPMGPVASQIAIKQLGTNGGGFFGVNSSHPFENPTPFSNFLQLISILLIPAALTYTYGKMVNNTKQGWVLFSTMFLVLVIGIGFSLWSEYSTAPMQGISQNLEGKEVRFGITNSILWSVSTTAASNGSVNAMHSSLTPVSGLITVSNILLGEIIFGGVGSGLYGMILFVIIAVFISGLMVGRTPEYLGKKIQIFEVKMAIFAIVIPSVIILAGTALSTVTTAGLSSTLHKGPHGLSEILYAFASAGGNNGSAFAGLNANTPYYNYALSIAMVIGRYGVIIPILFIAGSLAKKKITPESTGTLPTDTVFFCMFLLGTILIIGALTFFPVLLLGPIAEHLSFINNQIF
jgi:K+-transporting ATPase ATPase A chain